MSEHSNILAKYEKMFEDGSAYQPIKLNQQMPSMAEAGGGGVPAMSETPLGDPATAPVDPAAPREIFKEEFDSSRSDMMEAKIREAMNSTGTPHTGTPHANIPNVTVQNESYEKLEKRIALLEQALSLVMETQTKLLKESK